MLALAGDFSGFSQRTVGSQTGGGERRRPTLTRSGVQAGRIAAQLQLRTRGRRREGTNASSKMQERRGRTELEGLVLQYIDESEALKGANVGVYFEVRSPFLLSEDATGGGWLLLPTVAMRRMWHLWAQGPS